jgi:large subunit ribosomal protein L21
MYAIVKTGGKQYRVEPGQSLLVERLPVDDGASVSLAPLLYVDGDTVLDGDELGTVNVQARVIRHERGPKLRVVKFKPKRGYKRRTGHRQELTRLEVTAVEVAGGVAGAEAVAVPEPEPVAAVEAVAPPEPGPVDAPTEPEAVAAPTEPEADEALEPEPQSPTDSETDDGA